MAGIRSDVSDLSASQELLKERVGALEARVNDVDSNSTGVRGEDSALEGPQLSELTFRLSSIEASRLSPDICISGIPASITDSSRTMVLKVLEAVGIPDLAVNVLDVHCLTKTKDSSVIGDHRRPSVADIPSLSFIVILKSLSDRDHIVSRKRQIKNLTINKVFAVDRPAPREKFN